MANETSNITRIIKEWQLGNVDAERELYQFAYLQLRNIAQTERARSAKKHGEDNHVLIDSVSSTSALIHDAYLKMSTSDLQFIQNKRDFFLMATKVMRQILIDNSRAQQAQKRQQLVSLNEETQDQFEQLIILDKAIDSFSQRYPRQSQTLKLKYLMGMQTREIGELLECSASLVEKDLKFSRCWLQSRLA